VSALPETQQVVDSVRAAVVRRGLATVAREIGLHRLTLATVLAGTARAGSVALLCERWRGRRPEAEP
jgi:hypothetical protein